MSQPLTEGRTWRPRRGHLLPALIAFAVAGAGAAAAIHVGAQPAYAGMPPAGPALRLPGVQLGPQTVTLITGDQVTLTPASAGGGNRYAISVRPATRPDGLAAATQIIADRTPDGRSAITARPLDAEPYLRAGTVDRGLFDVTYLAAHEAAGKLRVVVQYATAMTDAELAARAGALPVSTLAQTLDDANAAAVDVDLAHAGQFWAAVTGQTPSAAPTTDALSGGISAIWLDGHKLGGQASITPATVPEYTVREVVNMRTGARQCTALPPFPSMVCAWTSTLFGVDGTGAGTYHAPVGYTCLSGTPPCRSVQITFRVPAGRYWLSGLTRSYFDDRVQMFELDNPELRVANDTTVRFNLDDASQIVNKTPQPSEVYENTLESTRTLPDGTQSTNLLFAAATNYWATPTEPVTVGTYFLKTMWSQGQPLVSASVTAARPIDLHPTYPGYRPGWSQRFRGRQTLDLVDGGTGSAGDLAKVDARGKLVLVHPDPDAYTCVVMRDQLANARQAGAAGVLIDPTQPKSITGQGCLLPMYPYWFWPDVYGADRVDMPFAEVTYEDVQTLHALMNQGPVKITITDNGDTPYLYKLTDVQRGQIAANLTRTVSDKQLAEVDAGFHSRQPAIANEQTADWMNDEILSPATNDIFATPVSRKIYIGPVSPETLYLRFVQIYTPADYQLLGLAQKIVVYSQAGPNGNEEWNDQPSPPGVPQLTGVWQAQPGRANAVCSGCRQGDVFMPWAYPTSADPQTETYDLNTFLDGLDPSTVHLYQDGNELPQLSNPYGFSAYGLPAATARYRLTMAGGNVHTSWDFTSAEPTADTVPGEYVCAGAAFGDGGHCQAVPLIFLRYDAGADTSDTLIAPGAHQLRISAYHQGPEAPAVTGLKVWTSVDGGKTWVSAPTAAQGDGSYIATYSVPEVSATDGELSVKVTATDAGGNDVTQVITDAYVLTAR